MQAVYHEAASRKRPSTPTLLRWPSRWGLCGRCSHFGRTIHATHCQRCVWRHLAWTVIFGLRHAVLRQYIPRKLPLRYAPISTMHICIAPYTSVWLYLQPHHAPHLFAEGPAVWLAIWRNGCCVEEVAECAKVILLFQVRNPPVQSRSHQGYRLLFQYNIFQARLV